MKLTLVDYMHKVEQRELNPDHVIDHYLKMAKNHTDLNAYIRVHEDYVAKHREEFVTRPFRGAPIAIKDIILTQDYISSCGSKMLENYKAPYSATCFRKLEEF